MFFIGKELLGAFELFPYFFNQPFLLGVVLDHP